MKIFDFVCKYILGLLGILIFIDLASMSFLGLNVNMFYAFHVADITGTLRKW